MVNFKYFEDKPFWQYLKTNDVDLFIGWSFFKFTYKILWDSTVLYRDSKKFACPGRVLKLIPISQ